MISSPGLRVPEPLTQMIPTSRTSWREVRQPYETLDMVPDLSTVRFELDVSLLVYQPLNYITVTLDWQQIDTKEYTVDDLKDVIYSRLGQHARPSGWPFPRLVIHEYGKSHTLAPLKISSFTLSTHDRYVHRASLLNIPVNPFLFPTDLSIQSHPVFMMMPLVNSDYH